MKKALNVFGRVRMRSEDEKALFKITPNVDLSYGSQLLLSRFIDESELFENNLSLSIYLPICIFLAFFPNILGSVLNLTRCG